MPMIKRKDNPVSIYVPFKLDIILYVGMTQSKAESIICKQTTNQPAKQSTNQQIANANRQQTSRWISLLLSIKLTHTRAYQ